MKFLHNFWGWLVSVFTVGIGGILFREALGGFAVKIGEKLASWWTRKEKLKVYREKIAHADSRDKLHDFMAREMVKVNDRLDGCERRHRDRDHKEAQRYKELKECSEARALLEVKNAKLKNEYDKAALENSILAGKLAVK